MSKKPTVDLWAGIRRHGNGWQATVSRGRDRARIFRHFQKGTDPRVMQEWREDERAALRLARKARPSKGAFTYDAAAYLQLVTTLPTYKERVKEIGLWVAAFGTKRREAITAADIRRIRDAWLTEPRSEKDRRPLAAGTVNKRLRALSNVWTVLDGARADNPVRDVPELDEPDPEPRKLTYDLIRRILAALPDQARPVRGKARGTVSKTKIRMRCMGFCQITPRQLGGITPADLDLKHARLRLPARKKGRGAKAIWTPLLPEAVDAFKDFDHHGCYGRFSQSSLRQSFHRAIARAEITTPGLTPYDMRHAFGALAYQATQSLEAVGKLLQHASPVTTQRYALAAEADVVAAHGARVAQHFGARTIDLGGTSPNYSAPEMDEPLTPQADWVPPEV